MIKKSVLILVVLCAGVFVGCQTTQEGDVVVRPQTAEKIDEIAAVAEPLGQTVSSVGVFWPPAALLGGLIAGAAGVWKKVRPEIVTAKSEAELGELAGKATAAAIEQFKKAHPDEWSSLSMYLADNHGTTVENFYRGLRGLPPKE